MIALIVFTIFHLSIGMKARSPAYTSNSNQVTQYINASGKVDDIASRNNQHQWNDIISYVEKQDVMKWTKQ